MRRCCNSAPAGARSCVEAPGLSGRFRLFSSENGHLEHVHGASAPSPPSQLPGGRDARARIGQAPALRPGRRGGAGTKRRLQDAARLLLRLGLPGCSLRASQPRRAPSSWRLALARLRRATGSWGSREPAAESHGSAGASVQMCITAGSVGQGACRAARAWCSVAPSARILPVCVTARVGCGRRVWLLLREQTEVRQRT